MELRLRVLGGSRLQRPRQGPWNRLPRERPHPERCVQPPRNLSDPSAGRSLASELEDRVLLPWTGTGSLGTGGGLLTPERTTARCLFLIKHSQGGACTPLLS